MQNKIFLISISFIIGIFSLTIFASPAHAAIGDVCTGQAADCCEEPQILKDGGGCPAGTVWIDYSISVRQITFL